MRTGSVENEDPEFLTHLSYGVTAIRQGTVCVRDGTWYKILHVELPTMLQAGIRSEQRNDTMQCNDSHCRQAEALFAQVQRLGDAIRQAVRKFVDRAYMLIPEVGVQQERNGTIRRGEHP